MKGTVKSFFKSHFSKYSQSAAVISLIFLASLLSVRTKGQAICNGIIDTTRTDFCLGYNTPVTFSRAVAVGQNIEWLTSGDGTFNNRFTQNPTYTPGPADSVNGYVFIYLDVYKDDPVNYCSALPVTTLYFSNMRSTATPAAQTVCSGTALTQITLAGNLASITYNWTRDNTATITGMAASGTGNIRGTLVNTGNTPVTVTFTITPTVSSCTGTPITATVVVNPRVVATASVASQSICSKSQITPIGLTSTANNTTYAWTRTNTSSLTGIASSGSGNITGALTNTSNSSVTTTFTITPTANGCSGTAITSTVTVSTSSAPGTSSPALQSICSGSAISSISSSGAGSGVTYNWTRDNTTAVTGIASSGSGTITGTLTNTTALAQYTTFTITPSNNSCANRASVLITPAPSVTVTPSAQTVCSGTAITTITYSSALSGTTYSWTRNNTASVTGIASSGTGDISGTLTNATSSPVTVTFTITPTANGCAGAVITATVTVNPIPTIPTASPLSQTICSGAAIATINFSGSGTGVTYNWSRDNIGSVTGMPGTGSGNITGSLINNTSSAATVTFTVTPTNGCAGAARTVTVTVNPPLGNASATPSSQTICSGGSITSIIPSGISGATYNWTRDNTATVTGIAANGSGNITGALTNTTASPATVTFTVTPTVSGCQGAAITATAVVNPRPTAVISGSQNICSGVTPSNLSITFTGAAPWSFTYTDGTTPVTVNSNSSNPYTFSIPAIAKTYTVTALNDNRCTAIAADLSGSAVLTQLTYAITASAGSNGSISPNGVSNVNCGTNQTYTITANSGYTIQSVTVDGVSQGAISSYTFTNVTAVHTISAIFAAATNNITASAGSGGSITPAGIVAVAVGANQTFTITPNSCYQVADVQVNGVSQGAITSYTFNNVNAAQTIAASFVQISYGITASAGANGTISPEGTTNVSCGANQTYSIIPDAGYTVQNVVVDGVSQGAITTYTFTNVTAAHSISATFAATGFTINASAGSNGSISPAGAIGVTSGSNQAFTITPASCYHIADVLVDGISQGAISSYTFNSVNSAHTISASFSPITYNITASAGLNGIITPNGPLAVSCGSNQTYSITPDAGHIIQDVIVDGISQGAVSSYTFSNVTSAHTISAIFATAGYTITSGAGTGGTISPSGTVGVSAGSNQTFNIVANSCYQIADVQVDGVSQGAISTYTFTNITAPHTINAAFLQQSYNITASSGSNGSITPPGVTTVSCGSNQTYTITPAQDFAIQDVVIDGVSQGAISSFTFTNVTAGHTISASFVHAAFTITASAGANGNISPSGAIAVSNGGNQSFSITPNTCYQVADVQVDGVSQGAISNYTFSNVTASHTIAASFVQTTYTITASAGNNGSISPSGTTVAACGSNHTYTITANAGFAVQDVIVDGISQGSIATYTFTNVTTAHTISATFTASTYSITATAGANGNISPAGITAVSNGGSQSFSITPNACYQIADVQVDGVSQGAISNYTFSNLSASHTISASFVQATYSITASAGSNGNVSPAGSTNVACGSNQTYTITPNAGFAVQDVVVDGVSQGAVTTYTFNNVTAPHTLTANFVAITYAINANAGANGSVSPSGTTNVVSGSNQTFNVTANACYQIADVQVDGVSQGAISSYTFNNITAAHTISATFSQLQYSISASAGANGSITPAGSTNVACGSNQTYTITPNAGFVVQSVLVDGVSQGAITTYTFSNITASHTISATFTAAVACTPPTISSAITNILCRNASTGAINVTTTGGTAPFSYSWAGPNNFTANTEDISNVAAGSYTIVITANGGCTATSTISISQPAAALTATATATAFACAATTTTLTVSASGGTGARQYSLNGAAFQTTNTYTVTAEASPYIVTVKDANGCTVNTTSLTLAPAPTVIPAVPTVVTGPNIGLCGGGTFTYNVVPVPTATSYFWSTPVGGSIVSGQLSTQCQISLPSTFTNGGIWVTARNACGASAGFRYFVNSLLTYTAADINGPSVVSPAQTNVQYSLPVVAGATYNWLVPTGSSIVSGQGTNTITVNFGTTAGNVSVDVTNGCGTAARVNKAITFGAARPGTQNITTSKTYTATGNDIQAAKNLFTVFPNPAYNAATVLFGFDKAGIKYEVSITNALGKTMLVRSGMSNAGNNKIDINLAGFASGIYTVKLVTAGDIQSQKLVVGR